MKRIKYFFNNYRFEIVISLLAILFAFSPYIKPDLIIGSDSPFHLARIETLEQNLRYGIFPTKVHVDLCYGYGYGVGFFYPDFFLYIPALLGLLGLSLEVSFKLFAGMIITGIFTSVFYCVYRLTRDRNAALCSAIIFLFTNQVLGSFYYEFTLGTSLGLIFMPLAICGMYLFLAEDQKVYMLGVGFTGLIFSHVLSTTLALAVCTIILLLHLRKLVSTPGKIKTLLFTIIIVAGVTASFWLPMFEQFLSQKYRVSDPWTYVDDNVLQLIQLIRSDGFGLVLTSATIFLGLIFLIEKIPSKKLTLFYTLGLILLVLPLCKLFWRLFRNAFKFLQFPKRLLGPASILIIFAFGIWLSSCKINELYKKYIAITLLLFSLFAGLNYIDGRIGAVEDFGDRILYQEIAGIGSGEEWLPLETTRDFITTPNLAISNTNDTVVGSKKHQYFLFSADSTVDFYDVPFVWYKGYCAITSDGQFIPVTKNPNTGIVRVQTNSLSENTTITVWYRSTFIQILSYLISIGVFLCFIGYSGYKCINKRFNKE